MNAPREAWNSPALTTLDVGLDTAYSTGSATDGSSGSVPPPP